MNFAPGHYQTFMVKHKIHLGELNFYLEEGDILDFDGRTMRLGSEEFTYPKLRSAITKGWVFLYDDDSYYETTGYVPQSSDILVRPATPSQGEQKISMGTVNEEERVVGHREQLQQRRDAASQHYDDVFQQRGSKVASFTESGVTATVAPKRESLPLDMVETPRRNFPVVREDTGMEIVRDITGSVRVDARAGEETEQGTIVAMGRTLKPAQTRSNITTQGVKEEVISSGSEHSASASAGRVVGNISDRKSQIQQENRPQSSPRPPKIQASSTAPTPAPSVQTLDWDMSLPATDRANLAVQDYGDQPEILRQIIMIETPEVISMIFGNPEARGASS